jgi:hypothetical protein
LADSVSKTLGILEICSCLQALSPTHGLRQLLPDLLFDADVSHVLGVRVKLDQQAAQHFVLLAEWPDPQPGIRQRNGSHESLSEPRVGQLGRYAGEELPQCGILLDQESGRPFELVPQLPEEQADPHGVASLVGGGELEHETREKGLRQALEHPTGIETHGLLPRASRVARS